jgi:hypothetical protein
MEMTGLCVSKWKEDSFDVTFCCCTKKFDVQEKPHIAPDGRWKMKVGGIVMVRE